MQARNNGYYGCQNGGIATKGLTIDTRRVCKGLAGRLPDVEVLGLAANNPLALAQEKDGETTEPLDDSQHVGGQRAVPNARR